MNIYLDILTNTDVSLDLQADLDIGYSADVDDELGFVVIDPQVSDTDNEQGGSDMPEAQVPVPPPVKPSKRSKKPLSRKGALYEYFLAKIGGVLTYSSYLIF